jgi:sulfide dehydrogenase [flavocytochrome c] flavoprotein subunit
MKSRRAFLRLSASAAGAAAWPRWAFARGPGARARVLIVGGGFAGSACALQLRRLSPSLKITVVDPDETYVCCPTSNGVLVGYRGMQSLRVSRGGLKRSGIDYVPDRVTHIDTHARRASLSRGGELTYDRLVMAGGIRFLWNKPEGYTEAASESMPHAWRAGPQTELLAAQLKSIADGGVVAISVPAGPMRCPPGPFERASVIADFLHADKPRCKILIFDANNHFPRQPEFTEAWRTRYPGMIEWISVVDGGAVERVDPRQMLLTAGGREHRVAVANIIPPQAPPLLAVECGLASDHGWCPVKPLSFESTLAMDTYVIGDSCIADPMPKSASAACAQALQCAACIVASLAEHEPAAAELNSVCYSLLSADSALSIHGRFRASASGIETLPLEANSVSAAQEVAQADAWYRHTLQSAFASQPG